MARPAGCGQGVNSNRIGHVLVLRPEETCMGRLAAILLCLVIAAVVVAQAAPANRTKGSTKAAAPVARTAKQATSTGRAATPASRAAKQAGPANRTKSGARAPVTRAAKQAAPANVARRPSPPPRQTGAAAQKGKAANPGGRNALPPTPAAAERPVAKPDPAVATAYAAMPVGDRRALQSDLIWTGDYDGVVSDEFGDRSIAAVKSHQARSGADATGILSPEQRTALAGAAKARQETSGWRVVDDPATGARLAVPIKHA